MTEKIIKLIILTTLTMMAFAANSVFCRMALTDPNNDPLSFTLIRLFFGAVVLFVLFLKSIRSQETISNGRILFGSAALFSYALFFSLSYVQLTAGTGALILFSTVQITMIIAAYLRGQKLNRYEKIGMAIAICGFVYLLLPGLHMPPLFPASMMIMSGIAWGVYSLLGQSSGNSAFITARTFTYTVPLIIILGLFFPIKLTEQGLLWAIASGAITSGMGYLLWYSVLKKLKITTASIVQLSVPTFAAFGGVLFLNEKMNSRLIIACVLILGGIYMTKRKYVLKS